MSHVAGTQIKANGWTTYLHELEHCHGISAFELNGKPFVCESTTGEWEGVEGSDLRFHITYNWDHEGPFAPLPVPRRNYIVFGLACLLVTAMWAGFIFIMGDKAWRAIL